MFSKDKKEESKIQLKQDLEHKKEETKTKQEEAKEDDFGVSALPMTVVIQDLTSVGIKHRPSKKLNF